MGKFWSFIKRIFHGDFLRNIAAVDKYILPAISVVEKIKKTLEGKELKFVLDIIPGSLDNEISAKIYSILPDILLYLRLANECTHLDDRDKIVQCAIEALRKTDIKGRHAFYLNIASMLASSLSDGKLTWQEAVILAQYTYTEKFKKS